MRRLREILGLASDLNLFWQIGVPVVSAVLFVIAFIQSLPLWLGIPFSLGVFLIVLFICGRGYQAFANPEPPISIGPIPAPTANVEPKITILAPTDQSMVEYKHIISGEANAKMPIEVWVYSFKAKHWYLQSPVIPHGPQYTSAL